MMRLMGWKGGALGVRGVGLIEPLQPQLDVPKGVGLGHKMFKSSQLTINKLQRRVLREKYKSEQKAQNVVTDKTTMENVSENNVTVVKIQSKNDDVVVVDSVIENNILRNNTRIDDLEKPQINFNNNIIVTPNSPEASVNKANDDANVLTIKCNYNNDYCKETRPLKQNRDTCSPINVCDDKIKKSKESEVDSTGQIENNKRLTNKCSLKKIDKIPKSIPTTTRYWNMAKSEIGEDFTETIENGSCLINESIFQQIKNNVKSKKKTKKNTNVTSLEHNVIETVKSNKNEILRNLQEVNDENYDMPKQDSETKLEPCADKKNFRYLSDRIQFLCHLLALLQSDEKKMTVVSNLKNCVGFIDSMIWSLNQREQPTPLPLPNEIRIYEACALVMYDHSDMILSYRIEKKLLFLKKSEDSSKLNSLQDDVSCTGEYDLKTTHSVNEYHLYSHMPHGKKGFGRIQLITNRIVLEFLKSNDMQRVYDYGKSSSAIRAYVVLLISLLNQRVAQCKIEIGKSEQPIFTEMLNSMKNIFLIFRFDTEKSFFSKLQLEKVDFMKGCHNSPLVNEFANNSGLTVDQHIDDIDIDDIEIYPNSSNYFYNKDNIISTNDQDIFVNKSIDCSKIEEDKNSGEEEYLMGENWFDDHVTEEPNTNTESGIETKYKVGKQFENCVENDISKTYSLVNEEYHINDEMTNGPKENTVDEEISNDFHNWPKRIKKNESVVNVTNENYHWNTTENFKSNFEGKLKRKTVYMERNTIKEGSERRFGLANSDDTILENDKYLHEKLNTKSAFGNIDEMFIEKQPSAEIIPTEYFNDNNKNKGNDSRGHGCSNVAEENNIYESHAFSVNLRDVNKWPKKVLIVYDSYPENEMDATSASKLQTIIYESIIKERSTPRLECSGLKNGGIIYTCYDYKSYIWLYKHLYCYTLMEYEDVLDTNHFIEMKINSFIKVDTEVIFKNIERFHKDIITSSWKVLRTNVFKDYCVISIEVDDASMKIMKNEGYSLFVGMDRATISVMYD